MNKYNDYSNLAMLVVVSGLDTCTTFGHDFVVASQDHFEARIGRFLHCFWLVLSYIDCNEFTIDEYTKECPSMSILTRSSTTSSRIVCAKFTPFPHLHDGFAQSRRCRAHLGMPFKKKIGANPWSFLDWLWKRHNAECQRHNRWSEEKMPIIPGRLYEAEEQEKANASQRMDKGKRGSGNGWPEGPSLDTMTIYWQNYTKKIKGATKITSESYMTCCRDAVE